MGYLLNGGSEGCLLLRGGSRKKEGEEGPTYKGREGRGTTCKRDGMERRE